MLKVLIYRCENPRMKLNHLLQKCSFFLIKLAAFQASGAAYMKLHHTMLASAAVLASTVLASTAAKGSTLYPISLRALV